MSLQTLLWDAPWLFRRPLYIDIGGHLNLQLLVWLWHYFVNYYWLGHELFLATSGLRKVFGMSVETLVEIGTAINHRITDLKTFVVLR